MANKPNNPSLWSKSKSLAKSKFAVYPCVPMDSQALTKDGWKYYNELHTGEEILAHNIEKNINEWTPIIALQKFADAPIIRLFKKQTNFDIRCTPNHKWVLDESNSKYPSSLVEAQDITTHMKIRTSAILGQDNEPLDILTFFKKDSWVKNILKMAISQVQSFFASGIVYDGNDKGASRDGKKQTYGFSQKDIDHGLAMEIAATLLGYRVCSVIKKHNQTMRNWTFIRRTFESTQNLHKEDAGISDVWCPTTKHGTWIMKQNGYVSITGNSAYANGWAAKHYKSKGGTWRKAQMGMEVPQEENAMPMAGQIEMPKLDSFIPMMSKGGVNNPGFKSLPSYVQAKIKANMGSGGMTAPMSRPRTYGMNMMQTGGFAPQTNAGMSVLQEAMQNSRMGNPMAPVVGPDAMPMMKRGGMSYYQSGGKMPTDIARARFMAAADGNAQAAKSKASQYGYKLQEGGAPESIERIGEVDITKKRSFGEKVAGKYRQAKKAIGMNPYPKTEFEEGISSVIGQADQNNAGIREAMAQTAADNKKEKRNLAQRIGDEFPTYLNLSSKKNVVTDLADMASMGASKLGMSGTANTIQQGKQAFTSAGKSVIGKGIDFVNPLSIGANIVGGAVGTLGDLKANEYSDAGSRFAKTAVLNAVRGKASDVAGNVVGKTTNKFLGHGAQHQLQHAGQHAILDNSGLLVHREGGSIKEMYMMKMGGFPDRYKKMGFSGVDKPKRTSSGGKSHAVVTKVGGNYKLIRFGQQGVSGSPDGSARNKAFKARHAKNIAKGKSSAAYWANKIKWILFIPLMLWQAF